MTKEEKAAYQREWVRKNPEKARANRNSSYARMNPEVKRKRTGFHRPVGTAGSIRERNLWKRFKLTLPQYEEMFRVQLGLCAICKLPEHRLGKNGMILPLSVDHDHTSNVVRSLLCGDCNTALGLMRDDVLRFQEAVRYLLNHRGR